LGGGEAKKPKVLKRKGRDVEEALLFEDQLDEAALEEWERKMGLREDGPEAGPLTQKSSTASPELSGGMLPEAPGRRSSQGPEGFPTRQAPSWRQWGKLRWLGLAGVRVCLEERGPRWRLLLIGVAASLAICLALAAALWTIPDGIEPQVAVEETRPAEMVLEMIVPLSGGTAGLAVSVCLELNEEGSVRVWEVRREMFEAIMEMSPEELSGAEGTNRLRARVGQRLNSKFPSVKADGVRFLEYLIL